MLKRIDSKIQTKIFLNFNKNDEKMHFIAHEGCQNAHLGVDYAKTETGLSVCVTERGNYIVTAFSDLFSGKAFDFATGAGVTTKGSIFYNGREVKENFREKATYDSYAVIKSGEKSAVLYPLKTTDAELFIEYDKERNYIGFITVLNGEKEAKIRNIVKLGVCFSDEQSFIRENAEAFLFEECSLATVDY